MRREKLQKVCGDRCIATWLESRGRQEQVVAKQGHSGEGGLCLRQGRPELGNRLGTCKSRAEVGNRNEREVNMMDSRPQADVRNSGEGA